MVSESVKYFRTLNFVIALFRTFVILELDLESLFIWKLKIELNLFPNHCCHYLILYQGCTIVYTILTDYVSNEICQSVCYEVVA